MIQNLYCHLQSQSLHILSFSLVEPPSLAVYPSPLPLTVPGQVLTVHCEASGFYPLSLDLDWEFTDAEGKKRSLGQGSMTGHRQASDGTFTQSSRLALDSFKLGLGRGGEISCIAKHQGGSRRVTVTLNVIGESQTVNMTTCYLTSLTHSFLFELFAVDLVFVFAVASEAKKIQQLQ